MLRLLLALAAAAATAAPGATVTEAKREDDHPRPGVTVEPAELAAVPAGSRAVLEKLLRQVALLRSEMESLRAGKLQADARAARLSERVDGLEMLIALRQESESDDTPAEPEPEQDEPVEQRLNVNGTTRHRKQAAAAACGPSSWAARTDAVMGACCPTAASSGGGHRRRRAQQATTCPLPATCPSAACATAFVPYYEDCAAELQGHAAELPLPQFAGFYASCQDLGAPVSALQPVAVQMFRVLVNTEGASQIGAMFPGGGSAGNGGKLDPLQPLPLVPVPPPDATASSGDATTGAVTQYHRICHSADVASCVPECNAAHHGFELLATIDGTDTKFSCNLAHSLYSWMGAASEGGYLGSDSASFFSAVVSGAAGSYIVTLTADAGVGTDLIIQPGQDVQISGDPGLAAAPSWGSGGFTVQEHARLLLSGLSFASNIDVPAGDLYVRNTQFHSPAHLMLRGGVTSVSSCTWEGNDKDSVRPEVDQGILIHGHACQAGRTPQCRPMQLTLSNSSFKGNHFGPAGIYFDSEDTPGSLVRVEDCLFEHNIADEESGAINIQGQAALQVVGSRFSGNTVIDPSNVEGEGGAIRFCSSGPLHISSSVFDGNAVGVSGNILPDGCVLGCNPHAIDNALFVPYRYPNGYLTNADISAAQPFSF
eukprot:COSAG06_NODE_3455_length_5319_cov_12.049425_2_plen_655_part_00